MLPTCLLLELGVRTVWCRVVVGRYWPTGATSDLTIEHGRALLPHATLGKQLYTTGAAAAIVSIPFRMALSFFLYQPARMSIPSAWEESRRRRRRRRRFSFLTSNPAHRLWRGPPCVVRSEITTASLSILLSMSRK